MAITKIRTIKQTLYLAIQYIINPAKAALISSHACAPQTADLEFALTLQQNSRSGGTNKAYHLIQSFKPEEVSPTQAHEIGQQLLEQHLQGKYEYVLTTHVDKNHIHNHVVFCASSFIDHKKYNDCKQSYYQLRETSDKLCAEHHLSVIPPNENKGKSYYEWKMDQQGKSWKTELRQAIDKAVAVSTSYEAFLMQMQKQGYEIKHGKQIAFRAESQQRFTRAKTLGEAYCEATIQQRLTQKTVLPVKTSKKINSTNQPFSVMVALDKNKKAIESKDYEQWAKIHNLKQGARTVQLLSQYGIHSLEAWEKEKAIHQEKLQTVYVEINVVERELAHKQFILKQLTIHADSESSLSKTPKNKRQTSEYETVTLLHQTARKALQEAHITPNKQTRTELYQQVYLLQKKQQYLYKEHKQLKQTQKKYHIIEQNLAQILRTDTSKKQDKER
ncbi:TPA: relaxase/mobilization nuclease domain-containing protein [Listeria monocytogenes]